MFDNDTSYEMRAPDGSIVYRRVLRRSGWFAARWRGRYCPVLGGVRGPLWMSTAWGSSKA